MNMAGMMNTQGARAAEPWHLIRKVILLLLLVLALSLGLVLLQRRGSPAPLLLFNILADVSIGVVMGLGSRMIFRGRPWMIKSLVAAALSIVGLAFLGAITNNTSGIGPLRPDLVQVDWLMPLGIQLNLPVLPHQTQTDLLDAAHMLIAIDVSLIALRAWSARRSTNAHAPSRRASSGLSATTYAPLSATVVHSYPPAVSAPIRATAHVRSRPMVKPMRLVPAAVRPARRGSSPGNRRRNLLRRRPAVQIASYEEHRCPYCLQDIKRSDIRGSVECPICHTLHHKDCWDITGTCQVPHLNG